jgi:hypothetical protein
VRVFHFDMLSDVLFLTERKDAKNECRIICETGIKF